jgi:hypothetical protein
MNEKEAREIVSAYQEYVRCNCGESVCHMCLRCANCCRKLACKRSGNNTPIRFDVLEYRSANDFLTFLEGPEMKAKEAEHIKQMAEVSGRNVDLHLKNVALAKELSDKDAVWRNKLADAHEMTGKVEVELLRIQAAADKMEKALESRGGCLACQTHEHPVSREALSEYRALKGLTEGERK